MERALPKPQAPEPQVSSLQVVDRSLRPSTRSMPALPVALSAVMAAFLLLPTLVLLARGIGPGFWSTLQTRAVTDALRVSLFTTGCTLLLTVLFVTPVVNRLTRRASACSPPAVPCC